MRLRATLNGKVSRSHRTSTTDTSTIGQNILKIRGKDAADAFGRLIRLPMAEMCVSRSKEIWQLPNGMRNYVLDYTNRNGKHKGIATSVYPDGGVHTYFIEDINGLNLFRKGECIYRKKDGD